MWMINIFNYKRFVVWSSTQGRNDTMVLCSINARVTCLGVAFHRIPISFIFETRVRILGRSTYGNVLAKIISRIMTL